MVNFDLKYAMSLLWSEVNSFTGKNSTQISFLTYPEKSANVLTNTNPNLLSSNLMVKFLLKKIKRKKER